ncbi:protein SSX4-like [Sagmatias obliquidens]|uniref:protein SSX4-like n=1 Tax=Sagmatias obliquidens TaxID=3371155 RepID=UPI000F44468B|nr:protein SSX4-like [Lagenorhynchus obliquidens]
MNRGRSFEKSPREDSQKSEKNSKAFKDISKYFSKKEWADLGYSEKITYVYMKRNYDIMTDLEAPPHLYRPRGLLRVLCFPKSSMYHTPARMETPLGESLCPPGKANTSGQQSKKTSGHRRREINAWTHRLRERKNLVVYKEISDSEEDD